MGFFETYFGHLGEWNWLILAAVLFVLELLAPGIFLIWFGIAAAIVGAVSLVIDLPWQAQAIMFAALSVAAVLVGRNIFRKHGAVTDRPLLNRRAKQHIGRTYVVAVAIQEGRGKVKVGDSVWQAEGPDQPEGARVTVTDVDGVVLRVEPVAT